MQAGVRGAGSAHATYPGSKAPPASFDWFASIKPFGPAARLRFGFASTVAIKVGVFSTIKRSSMATRVLRFLFFGLETPLINPLKPPSSLVMPHDVRPHSSGN